MKDVHGLFLAMSGVRVQDEELLALGLTLPGFVERSRVIASLPSLGLLTIAAECPPHWNIEYRECDAEPVAAVAAAIVRDGFDLVAISSLSARIHEAYALADLLRAAGITVVLGGLHVSALPGEAAPHADALVVGEGEGVWARVAADFDAGRLGGIYRRSPAEAAPLGARAVPRYDLLEISRYNRLTIQATRGCPLGCIFCGASRLISPYRRKVLDQFRRELDAILAIWPRPFLELADDNTFLDKRWAKELVRMLGETGARWFTETDISVADDPGLLELLAASGCAQILIGLESARPRNLAGLDTRDWKRAQFDSCAARIARIQSHGIAVNGCFIVGFDGDDESIFAETLAYADAMELADVQVTLLTAFPGTTLRERLGREGRLPRETRWDRCTLFDLTFEPAGMAAEELRQGFRWLMGEMYAPHRVQRRREHFRNCVRRARRGYPSV